MLPGVVTHAQDGSVSSSASLRTTVAVVVGAALSGLVALAAVGPVASALDEERGLVEYVGLGFALNLAILAILRFSVTSIEGRSLHSLVRSWWQRTHDDERVGNPRLVWSAVVVAGVIGLSPLRLVLIDAIWAIAPGPSWSINSPDANEGILTFTVPTAVIVLQILVRIPFTVFVEESLFRGWVQDRHGPVVSGVLFASYHLAQWWTIPALVPFGIAVSLLRVATRSIWPGAALHAAGNIGYALSLA